MGVISYNELPMFFPSVVGLDIETTGLDRFGDHIIAIGISDGYETWILTENFEEICPLLRDPHTLKIIHNADFDLTMLAFKLQCKPKNIYDTLIVERILNNGYNISNDLGDTLARRVGYLANKEAQTSFILSDEEKMMFRGTKIVSERFDQVMQDGYFLFSDYHAEYLMHDVLHLPAVREAQMKEVSETGTGKVVKLENDTIIPVLEMTLTGMGFDLEQWNEVYQSMSEYVEKLQVDYRSQYLNKFEYIEVPAKKQGEDYLKQIPVDDINFNSPSQVKVMFHTLGIKVPNTGKNTLARYDDLCIKDYQELKEWLTRLKWHWDDYISPVTGRIHPKWNQLGTNTGRFSSKDPNAQQIPRPDGSSPNFRSLFKPLEGHTLICADYSQQEPRILADVSGDPLLIEAANESDVYIAFARTIWKEDIEKSDPRRQLAKIAVLATFYGSYPKNLSERLGISYEEASDLRDLILSTYPVAASWGDNQLRSLVRKGYTKTVSGRRWYFPEIENTKPDRMWTFANQARNAPIQGTGGEIMKLALCRISDILEEYDASLIWTVHDELGITVRRDQAEELYPIVIEAMEQAGQELCPSVKFIAEGKITDEWSH